MEYVRKSNKQVVSDFDIQRETNTSFPLPPYTDELLAPFGYAVLHRDTEIPPVPLGSKLTTGTPYEDNGIWKLPYAVVEMTQAEIDERLNTWRQSASCTPFQGRMALSAAGLLSQVETLMTNPATDESIKLAWEYALEWKRVSPMVEGLMSTLGISEAQADDLFIHAGTITA